MPSGVFRPYAGVSTAVLLFTKGGTTENIWFYDMEHDGYSLDDKRQKVAANDIPDVLDCWTHRWDSDDKGTGRRACGAQQRQQLVVKQDGERISTHQTQRNADARAATVARKDGVDRVTHGRDGKFRSKDSFGNDPNPTRDREH